MRNVFQEDLRQLELLVCYTPHTTPADADFVGRQLLSFRPDVYIPEDPNRSEEEVDNLASYYKRHISGEKPIGKNVPNYMFQDRLISYLRDLNSQKPFGIHFLERHPKNIVPILMDIHREELKHKELANYLFDLGKLEGALDELWKGLDSHLETVRVRAANIEKNLRTLPEDINERFPELISKNRVRVLSWISELYSQPVVQHNNCHYTVIEEFQRTPYTNLAHTEVLRKMMIGKKVDRRYLVYSFIQNILEKALREEMPDSVERFSRCVELSLGLGYEDIEELSRRVSETGTRDVILKSLLKKEGCLKAV